MTWRKPFYERHNDSIPRTVAGARRAFARTRKRLIRQRAQLRSAIADAERNLGVGIASRDRNVQLAYKAKEIMDQTRSERERILAASTLRVKVRERVLFASLVSSFALLAFSAWRVMQ